ncbi:MAG: hypothetical protein HYS52_00575 [Candidatus Wildermuthbacteria bacterium]|nr:hypothetical protein [Candidatus Wildermuthbacteria bacterium]
MPLTKEDLRQIKKVVVEAVDPYFTAIQKDFGHVYDRFDRIEKLMLADHKRRIEKLEEGVKELRGLLAA